jgi:hypothetical protein
MATWRTLGSLVVALALAGAARAQTYPLKEDSPVGTYATVKLGMELSGELKLQQEGKSLPLKESATATHEYVERVLAAAADGTAARTARFYRAAKVAIAVGNEKSERTLRDDRRLMICQREKDGLLTWCPKGPLTREELQLTEHFDTLALTGLLPGREVAVGETWKLANPAVQALCHFDGLTAQEVSCKLEEVKGDIAAVSVSGTASGIDLGAAVNLTVKGSYRFDLKARRIVGLEWKQTEERQQGPVSPAAAVEVTFTLTRTPVEEDAEVSDPALVPVPRGDSAEEKLRLQQLQQLSYAEPRGRYTLLHNREWHLVGGTAVHQVFRLMDRGEFVAQATLSPWKSTEPGKHLTGDEFKELIAETPGWVPERVLKAEEVQSAGGEGNWIYQVTAEGEMGGLKALQHFYLIAGARGEQMLVTFTMTPAQAQKLGTRDLDLLRGVAFPAPAAGAAADGKR